MTRAPQMHADTTVLRELERRWAAGVVTRPLVLTERARARGLGRAIIRRNGEIMARAGGREMCDHHAREPYCVGGHGRHRTEPDRLARRVRLLNRTKGQRT